MRGVGRGRERSSEQVTGVKQSRSSEPWRTLHAAQDGAGEREGLSDGHSLQQCLRFFGCAAWQVEAPAAAATRAGQRTGRLLGSPPTGCRVAHSRQTISLTA